VVREAVFPGAAPVYAGYLGWRGASHPDHAPPAGGGEACTVAFPGGHCMIYPIPDGSGGHRTNWVLYTVPPAGGDPTDELRTPTSLPPGHVGDDLAGRLRALVAEHFPPHWAERVLHTPPGDTLVQPIYDLEVPRYAAGRVLLVGDAATVARPHIGGGGVKAIQDAAALETAWRAAGTWEELAAAYDADRSAVGATMVRLGRRFGRAQVEATPDWHAMGPGDLDVWWREQNEGSERDSGFGGRSLDRA
jgi:2-polyprenyl-6-methoxyphenol hydroxylase-like FAD-dependent oxidoreductase